MVRVQKWLPFLGPKFQFLAKKSDFCHTTPILVDDPFLGLGMTVNFRPWKPFFDFPFRSYSAGLTTIPHNESDAINQFGQVLRAVATQVEYGAKQRGGKQLLT